MDLGLMGLLVEKDQLYENNEQAIMFLCSQVVAHEQGANDNVRTLWGAPDDRMTMSQNQTSLDSMSYIYTR